MSWRHEEVRWLHAPLIPCLAEQAQQRLDQRTLARAVTADEDVGSRLKIDLDRTGAGDVLKVRVSRGKAAKISQLQFGDVHAALPVSDVSACPVFQLFLALRQSKIPRG